MALLDFIKNRGGQRAVGEQQSQQQTPETAKQMHTREALEEKATAKPVSQIPEDQRAKAAEVGEKIQAAIKVQGPDNVPDPPSGGASSAQPMRQQMMSQDKAAPAMSPTSAQAGVTETEQKSNAPSQAQESSPSRQQTIARPAPSWER
jgi:hypothetical protein